MIILCLLGGLVLLLVGFIICQQSWEGWTFWTGTIVAILGLFIMMGGVSLIEEKEKSEEMKSCEDIGGELTVVGSEYSYAKKRTVEVYGCMKKEQTRAKDYGRIKEW